MSKRSIDSFFIKTASPTKKPRLTNEDSGLKIAPRAPTVDHDASSQAQPKSQETAQQDPLDPCLPSSEHETYPWPVSGFPISVDGVLANITTAKKPHRHLKDKPDLDVLYFQPFFPRDIAKEVFLHLRRELFFYRVEYTIKRDSFETKIKTPRYTTVFGLDATARFHDVTGEILDAKTRMKVPAGHYNCRPRPIPGCLLAIKEALERATGCQEKPFNFVLVNYYAGSLYSLFLLRHMVEISGCQHTDITLRYIR